MANPAPPPAPGPQKKPTAKPRPEPEDDVPSLANDDDVLEVYNQRHEFHIAIGATGLLHVLVAVGLIFLFSIADSGSDKSSPPIQAAEVAGLPSLGESDDGNDRD